MTTDESKAPIVERIFIQVGPDITVTVDSSTFVPTPKQTAQWHTYVRKRAHAIQRSGIVQDLVAWIRSLIFIPEGGFTDSSVRWRWHRWAESESFMFANPAGQNIIDWLTRPYELRGEQAIPPTIPRILDLAVQGVLALEGLNDDWYMWVHTLFVLDKPGDPAIIVPTPAKLPPEAMTYRQAAAARREADDRDTQGQRDELEMLRKALVAHRATGLSDYKIGTTTQEGRRFLELKGVGQDASRRQITNTIANALRNSKPRRGNRPR